ncbi:TetR family transcriptional regulator [Gordonia sp. TBRC 11910]|uniref:TetR family transcriptional regulator n=1 Tax=Gordonia asplenii TaxID=2725283 RepID=A0A848LB04_9ACTN|nr:TetR/AcrR family transcriptional regulator C-terminal domain-containing protein [Gordonia asplenii]NMO04758.1 TetR family transcriptional regulator [Gordonia asplenii]
MTSASRTRRGRPPRGTTALSRESIVEAALTLIDDDGIATVSMRSVARRLGVDAKSLYNHVPDKDGLLDAVAESLLGAMRLPQPTGDLRADLVAIGHAFREAALRHPRAAPLVLTRQLESNRGLAPIEATLAVLLDAGFPPDEAVHILRATIATLIGTLLREVDAGPTVGSADAGHVAARTASLTSAGFPRIAAAAPALAHLDADAEFAFTLDLALDAITARLDAGGHPHSAG